MIGRLVFICVLAALRANKLILHYYIVQPLYYGSLCCTATHPSPPNDYLPKHPQESAYFDYYYLHLSPLSPNSLHSPNDMLHVFPFP